MQFRGCGAHRGWRPRVIRNDPFLFDGTPMPTLYWLVGPNDVKRISQLESKGGVRQADAAIAPELLEQAHLAYARERDSQIPGAYEGPRPSGESGVALSV